MNKSAIVPILSSYLAAETVTTSTPLSLGLFLAGVVFTGALLWREGRYRQRNEDRLKAIEKNCRERNKK